MSNGQELPIGMQTIGATKSDVSAPSVHDMCFQRGHLVTAPNDGVCVRLGYTIDRMASVITAIESLDMQLGAKIDILGGHSPGPSKTGGAPEPTSGVIRELNAHIDRLERTHEALLDKINHL